MSENPVAQTTGKFLVLFRQDAVSEGVRLLSDEIGIQTSNVLMFDELGVAVVDAEPTQLHSLRIASEADSPILAIEPEQVVYALQDQSRRSGAALPSPTVNLPVDYLRGYQDAVANLVNNIAPAVQSELMTTAINESQATWGLQATKVVSSSGTGAGIKVAVLDTGFDFTHPDFFGRQITSKSFVTGEDVQDKNGHGTHCIGTACGSKTPKKLPRYGIAHKSEIFAAKVLSNQGSGTDTQILQGIEWAVANGCQIISMSLGAPTKVGDPHSPIYEAVAQRALQRGTLIIAAAGNESRRPDRINPVARPANCPSIMAVAALDTQEQVAIFSTQAQNPDGGQIDIAAPGVDVHSSWLMPTQYRKLQGTSMATPHVAGIAALHAEVSGARGQTLWNLLTRSARRLPLPAIDVGAGIVQAPAAYDRFNVIWLKSSEDRVAVWGWAREHFDGRQAELQAQGYRLIDLNAFMLPNGQGERFNAIWRKSNEDRVAIWGWAREHFDTRQAELQAQGYRLMDLNAFVLPNGQGERFNAIWLRSNEDRVAVWGWAREHFDVRQAELQSQGYRLVRLNAFVLPEGVRFNAIWLKSNEDRVAVWGWAREHFDGRQAELQAQGYRLIDLNAFVLPNGEGERYNAIWCKSNEDQTAVWGRSREHFESRQAELQSQGYRLASLNAFMLN